MSQQNENDLPTREEKAEALRVFRETIAGSLIDAARINVNAAMALLPAPPEPLLVQLNTLENQADTAAETTMGSLEQAMIWLENARELNIKGGVLVTSLHVVGGRGTPP